MLDTSTHTITVDNKVWTKMTFTAQHIISWLKIVTVAGYINTQAISARQTERVNETFIQQISRICQQWLNILDITCDVRLRYSMWTCAIVLYIYKQTDIQTDTIVTILTWRSSPGSIRFLINFFLLIAAKWIVVMKIKSTWNSWVH